MPEKLWEKRREFYKNSASVASARAEDQVADNICRGLGFQPACIGRVEARLGIELDAELPKIQHARTVLNVLSHGRFSPDDGRRSPALLDVRDVKDVRKWLEKYGDEYAAEASGREIGVIVCVRGSDPKSLRALVFTEDTPPVVQPWILQPGAYFVDRRLGSQIWSRQLQPLISDMSRFLKWDRVVEEAHDPD